MSEAGTVPLEPRTSEEGRSRRGNTGTRSAPHPYQSGLRSETVVLLGPPACEWEGLGHRKGSIPLLNCLPLSHRPSPASVSPCVRLGVQGPWLSLIGNPAGPGSLSGHGRPLCVSAQTMARPLSSPPGPALLLHHRGPRGFWAAGEGRLLQSAAPPSSHAAAPRAPGIPWQKQTCKFAGRSQLGVWWRARGGGGGGGSGGRGAHRLRAGRVAAAALRRVRARRGPPAAPPAAGRAGAGRGRAAEARVAGARARRAQHK